MSVSAPPLATLPEATTIDEVVGQLSAVIDWAAAHRSRMGYFAALYRKVTQSVREGIHAGAFENGSRMERFDVIFANRYLGALRGYLSGEQVSTSWKLAFDSAADYWPIVLQHLLLGMNAHINLDLGIAAAETMKDQDLEEIHADFNKINAVLASLVDSVQDELSAVWAPLRGLTRYLGAVDDAIVNFSMRKARDEAWRSAQTFRYLPSTHWPEAIALQDKKTLLIGSLVRKPGFTFGSVTRLIRVGEVKSIPRVIEILS